MWLNSDFKTHKQREAFDPLIAHCACMQTTLSSKIGASIVFILGSADVCLSRMRNKRHPVILDKHPSISSLGLWYHGHLLRQALQPTTLPPFPQAMWFKLKIGWGDREHAVCSRWLNAQSQQSTILRACLAFHKNIMFVLVCWYDTMIGSITKTAQCCIYSRLLGSGKKMQVILQQIWI